jgi:hypothetical protein
VLEFHFQEHHQPLCQQQSRDDEELLLRRRHCGCHLAKKGGAPRPVMRNDAIFAIADSSDDDH